MDHGTYGHESILKLISYRFGLGFLNKRHRYARNIGRSFEWKRPDFERPTLPDPPQVASQPCTIGGGGGVFDSQQAHANDLAGLEALARPVRRPGLRRQDPPDLHQAGLGEARLQEAERASER